jgi:hypothetical protein
MSCGRKVFALKVRFQALAAMGRTSNVDFGAQTRENWPTGQPLPQFTYGVW